MGAIEPKFRIDGGGRESRAAALVELAMAIRPIAESDVRRLPTRGRRGAISAPVGGRTTGGRLSLISRSS